MLNSKKTIFAIIGAILLIGGIACTLILLAPKNQKHLTPQELLSLGNKYLSELDYENAVVAFTKLIEIEPRNPQGYIGLAEAYIGLGDIDRAIEILDQGLEATGDDEIRHMLEELLNPGAGELPVETLEITDTTTVEPQRPPHNSGLERMEFAGYDWLILEKQIDRILVISEYILENYVYHESWGMAWMAEAIWDDSDIRSHLNNEFFSKFSTSDKVRIIEVTNKNQTDYWGNIKDGIDTKDKIFLLSLDEVVKYFGDSGQLSNQLNLDEWWIDDEYNERRIAYHIGGTYVNPLGDVLTVDSGQAFGWWLRTPNGYYSAADVAVDGRLYVGAVDSKYGGLGVRPALWLSLE